MSNHFFWNHIVLQQLFLIIKLDTAKIIQNTKNVVQTKETIGRTSPEDLIKGDFEIQTGISLRQSP